MSAIFPHVVSLLRLSENCPLPNPLPRWYDMSTYCNYHRATGHSTDNCHTLRDVIQNLIDNEVLVVSAQEPVHTLAPAHPSIASLSSPEPASSGDAGTSWVYLLTPILVDSSCSSMDRFDLFSCFSLSLSRGSLEFAYLPSTSPTLKVQAPWMLARGTYQQQPRQWQSQ